MPCDTITKRFCPSHHFTMQTVLDISWLDSARWKVRPDAASNCVLYGPAFPSGPLFFSPRASWQRVSAQRNHALRGSKLDERSSSFQQCPGSTLQHLPANISWLRAQSEGMRKRLKEYRIHQRLWILFCMRARSVSSFHAKSKENVIRCDKMCVCVRVACVCVCALRACVCTPL